MAFPDSFLDEIRARVPVSEVAAKKVRLVRHGHEHKGLCPFHDEKTPSFTVNDAKGFYHCFGCEAHGSVFDFLMKTDGLAFPEAVERLAAQAGLEMPARTSDPHEQERRSERERLTALMEEAAAWFESQLRSGAGAGARTYLESRGLDGAPVQHFRVGFAPDSRASLQPAMEARGYAREEMIAAGLLVVPDDGRDPYDRFRNRVTFPITDSRGRTVGFGGRTLGDSQAKYLNSPETALFHKGALLYNLAGSRAAARKAGTVIVAEGYTDVIALWKAGFKHAVAPLGTALTERQMTELWRMAPEPVLCLDGDSAGWNAAVRAARNALPLLKPGHSFRFAMLPGGEDPDSLLRERGPDALVQVIEDALPLAEVLWRTTASGDTSTPERKAGLRKSVHALVGEIADATVRDYYRRHFEGLLGRMFGAAPERGRPGRAPQGVRRRGVPRPERRLSAALGLGADARGSARVREETLVATLLNHPELLETVAEDAAGIAFESPDLDKLCNKIIEIGVQEALLDCAALHSHLTDQVQRMLAARLSGPKSGLVERFLRPDATLGEALAGWRGVLAMHRRASLAPEHEAAVRALEAGDESGRTRLEALNAEEIELTRMDADVAVRSRR
jgi:DNA primase